jgi:tripartite-type tricarboxylate transporter receptor subunit TctC
MQWRRLLVGLLAISVALLVPAGHRASSQTTRPIKIIVPFPPGGNTDALARLLAGQVGRAQGATMVIENRPGASTEIGMEAAARAISDGNTLLIIGATFLVRPHLRKLSYDPLTSFEPICDLTSTPEAIVVNSASPYRTIADLLDAARFKSGELTLAGIGPGTATEIAFERLKRAANVDMTFVPYPGNAPAVNALLGEHVTSVLADYTILAEQLKAGRLRALATLSPKRVEPFLDVPTLAESGFPNFQMEILNWLFAPANTPKEAISRLAGWFAAALQAPEVRPKLVKLGLYPVGMCGPDFAAHVRTQYEEYGNMIREANIKAD